MATPSLTLLRLLVLAIACLVCVTRAHAVDVPEVEPNNSKATATPVVLSPGDAVLGVSTGSMGTGLTSADYFDISIPPPPAGSGSGIFRYRLTLATGTAGHSITIRGLTQTNGVINQGTDATLLQGTTTGARYVQWYAPAVPTRLHVRVTGTPLTTDQYRLELQRWDVTIIDVPTQFVPGPMTITSVGQTVLDTDLWLYDGMLAPIPDAGNDDEFGSSTLQSRLTRTLPRGTYTVAIGEFNFANHLPSPPDDDFRSGEVADFPGIFLSRGVSPNTDCDIVISHGDGSAATPVTLNRWTPFGVVFARFSVGGADVPMVEVSATPNPVAAGAIVQIGAIVTPPGGTTITSVVANLSAIGLPSVALSDIDADDIWTALVPIPISQSPGSFTISVDATDSSGGVGNGQTVLTIVSIPPPNDTCAGAIPISLGSTVFDSTLASGPDASLSCALNSSGVWFTYSAGPAPQILIFDTLGSSFDTVLAAFTACGGVELACNNNIDPFTPGPSRIALSLIAGQSITLLVSANQFFDQPPAPGGPFVVNITPGGACCIGAQCSLRTQQDCISHGGTFAGLGLACTPALCAPPNDECAGATVVSVGLNAATNLGYTTSVTITPTSLCGTTSGSGGGTDAWHIFTAPASTTYGFDLCQGSNSFDSVLAVYSACPVFKAGAWSPPIACNDDERNGCSITRVASRISGIPLSAGETAWIRVAVWSGGAGGPYVLNITQDPQIIGACCLHPVLGQPRACMVKPAVECQSLAGSFAGPGTTCGTGNPITNPVACCPPNFNQQDGVTVQDIFDFLFAWTNLDPAADFNQQDGITVQDIFDFLAAWNDGCE
jgi:hypothetical protein